MKRDLLRITVFVLCFTVLLSGCDWQSDPAGVHEEGGVHNSEGVLENSSKGPDIQVGAESQDAIVIEDSGRLVTKPYDFEGFDEIEASMFDLDIRHGEPYAVIIEVEENALDYVQVVMENNRLELGLAPGEAYNMADIRLRAQITLPELAAIALDLGSDSTATGFDCGALHKDLRLGSSLTCDQGAEQVRFEAEF